MKLGILGILKYIGAGIIAFYSPITYALIFTIALVTIDTITGTMKAGRKSVEDISSKKAFRIVPKLIFYGAFISIANLLTLHIDPNIPFVKLSLIGIGWIEIKSIDENFKAIYGFSFIDKILEGAKKLKEVKRYKEDDE